MGVSVHDFTRALALPCIAAFVLEGQGAFR